MTPDAGLFAASLCRCGSTEVIAIAPGNEPERWAPGGFMVSRGAPIMAFCEACWRKAHRVVGEA